MLHVRRVQQFWLASTTASLTSFVYVVAHTLLSHVCGVMFAVECVELITAAMILSD
ncbi:hypothetical protein SAMN05192552_104417 [Natrinema hispanicum]|uniref:Uncharacterized protein n=1 Tax=Natrinema hispanicum TaxID=392421 RepID=A0A1G6X850_9EURY|nr:hypothetical protein BDK88_4168 [Natrinema hispanicum]SDD74319.1 hypothetical protein SAMN05192552_104417 [Natrinema hispanicum]SEU05842.1 hypothetical protein SAMN04488694_1347 [Natrinema hispanicum]